MKKIALCVMVCALFVLASCGDRTPGKEVSSKLKVGFIYVSPVGDGGWTWAHDQGRKELAKLPYVETTSIMESVPEGAEATRAITQFAEKGFTLIFTTSFGYMDPTVEVAKRYPNHVFMHCSGYKTLPNVGTYFGRMYQPRYLSGIVAGKKTQSNVIGYVAAFPIPEVIRGINAFTLGVRSVNPEAKVHVVWSHTWYDPAKEREAAESLLDLKADIIAQHQDSPAAQQAAQDRGRWSIGYNTNMRKFAPKAHLTAPVWDWSKVYTAVAEQVNNKTWKSEKIWWGIKTGVVDLAPISNLLVAQDVRDYVMAKRQEIIADKCKIFEGPLKDQSGNLRCKEGEVMSDDQLLSFDFFVEGVVGTIEKGNK
jgi:basic membrane protein A